MTHGRDELIFHPLHVLTISNIAHNCQHLILGTHNHACFEIVYRLLQHQLVFDELNRLCPQRLLNTGHKLTRHLRRERIKQPPAQQHIGRQ